MRMSRLFGETLRQPPADALVESHRWLVRAGYMRALAPGLFSYLPLGVRAKQKLEAILRNEMCRIGGQEIAMPLVQPAHLWRASGRLGLVGQELVSFADRAGRQLLLATSHEEVALELAKTEIRSHRRTPALLFQIQTTFRDESTPRAGLLRAREFTLLASYAFDRDQEASRERYRQHQQVFSSIFRSLPLTDVVFSGSAVESLGAPLSHDYVWLNDVGDLQVAICESCGYTANQQVARFRKPPAEQENLRPLERVSTPGADTIESLARYPGVTADRTGKVVFFSARIPESISAGATDPDVLVMALVRGDMEVSVPKLQALLSAERLGPAEETAIRSAGAEPGFASPVGLQSAQLIVVADDLVAATPNLICGANEPGYHLLNMNYRRDYTAAYISDIALAVGGAACPDCSGELRLAAGVEVASLHRFGSEFAEAFDTTYQDERGSSQPLHLSSYGIGVDRLLACLAEAHHDDQGLCLPASIAPYQIHLVALASGDAKVLEAVERLFSELTAAGYEVLYDDRDVAAGVKFNDADLIGLPLRLTIGARSLKQGTAELKRRDRPERSTVNLEELSSVLRTALDQLSPRGPRPDTG